ncbi:GNAT family N-acetyltransferase [uncultured Sphaerochaeta sp.]|uniref:GNAT family N-acetyltransferase n=1 Tax=uncultured Sphaerochaeta sp. TaxID=886478 RepID=UPI002A0A72D1|nr:GNAT family N-acetyltransferase [uncultured Sphaerochaeta sp.]
MKEKNPTTSCTRALFPCKFFVMHYETTDHPKQTEIAEIYENLKKFNLAHLENQIVRELAVFAHEDGERLAGGLSADTHGNWLEILYLWVDEKYRGQGLGTNLLAKAEAEALQRGCSYAFLNTFGFQAKGFYEKQGYTEVFVLEAYPETGTRHYMKKTLQA